jgi:hypothetical protein
MKAFEKHLASTRVRATSVDAEIMRQTWQAFGEWLLTQHPCGYMRDIIEKELEEE